MSRRLPLPQFSLKAMLLAMVAAAFACAAMWNASDLWASAAWTIALAALGFALLAAGLRRGRQRAYWLGFLLFGLGYLTLAHGPWFDGHVRHRLLSDKLLVWLYGQTPAGEAGGLLTSGTTIAFSPTGNQLVLGSADNTWSTNPAYTGSTGAVDWYVATGAAVARGPVAFEPFQQVGHSLSALLLALLGAAIARRMYGGCDEAIAR